MARDSERDKIEVSVWKDDDDDDDDDDDGNGCYSHTDHSN